ncbi:MAG: HlyD family efflux transporter periplasmic adaptor subunit [Deltaproteobacteria bacterium]|nr:HlyD family efflux transporter periplasmic adaptor subunit [Deltaproteobacteria bacterium]
MDDPAPASEDTSQQHRPRRRLVLVAVFAAIAAGAAIFVLFIRQPVPSATLLVSGNIEAHQSLVGFKQIQSKVTELPFDEGQWVEKGTLLAQADDDDYRQQVTLSESQLTARRQELASAVQNLLAARETVHADEAESGQKWTDYKRFEAVWQQQVAAQQARDQALTSAKQSQATLERDRALVGVAARNVATAEANVKAAADSLRLANITLGYTVLRAPFSGVILVRNAELGEAVQPGTPIVTLADLDHVWLRAYINETDLGKVVWGQPAIVTTDTWPGRHYAGRISFISSEAEFTPKSVETHSERVMLVYRIKIDVDNSHHQLKPGMPADALINLAWMDHRASGIANGQAVIH